MDWANVTPGELADALREVDWNMRPRPLTEFFAKFTPPKSQSKLTSRLKCNVSYRANWPSWSAVSSPRFRGRGARRVRHGVFLPPLRQRQFRPEFQRARHPHRAQVLPPSGGVDASERRAGGRPFATVRASETRAHLRVSPRARRGHHVLPQPVDASAHARAVDGDVGAGMVPSHRGGARERAESEPQGEAVEYREEFEPVCGTPA